MEIKMENKEKKTKFILIALKEITNPSISDYIFKTSFKYALYDGVTIKMDGKYYRLLGKAELEQ
jgi:hypothetical protein